MQGALPELVQHRLPSGESIWCVAGSEHEVSFIYKEIVTDGVYDKHAPVLQPHCVVVDAGANIGLFTLSLLARDIPLRLLCFEPVTALRDCLQRNLATCKRHPQSRIEVLDCALGAVDARGEINFLPRLPGNSTLFPQRKASEMEACMEALRLAAGARGWFRTALNEAQRFDCSIQRLSTVIGRQRVERIDLLKIDVEGAELDVLAGLDEAHWSLIRAIAMECAPSNKPHLPQLAEQLRERGFATVTISGHSPAGRVLGDAFPCMLYARR